MSPEEIKHIEKAFEEDSGPLLQFIRKRIPNDEEAKDILQDVFYQLISLENAIETIDNVSAWLFRVAKNKIIDRGRKKKPELFSDKKLKSNGGDENDILMLEHILPALSPDPEDEFMRSVILDAIYEALLDLPVEQRDVFILHEFEDLSFKEIAELTGEGVNTLISRKRYAVLYLREYLKDLYNQLN